MSDEHLMPRKGWWAAWAPRQDQVVQHLAGRLADLNAALQAQTGISWNA
jgi:hypothetical protein